LSLSEPEAHEIAAAKLPHDIFLMNLIMNHILFFTGLATLGKSYIVYLAVVPAISVLTILYTLYRAKKVKPEDSQFVYIHWQIARRWSILFSYVLILLASVATLSYLGYQYTGLMKEAVYAFTAGLGGLPTLVTVLVLIVIESDSLHHAKSGSLPKWARRKFLNEDV